MTIMLIKHDKIGVIGNRLSGQRAGSGAMKEISVLLLHWEALTCVTSLCETMSLCLSNDTLFPF